jgi:hypothetical protein
MVSTVDCESASTDSSSVGRYQELELYKYV